MDARERRPRNRPGRVSLDVDIRSVEYDSMDAVVDAARESMSRLADERGVETALDRGFDLEPQAMDERVQAAAETTRLYSGAFHDSANVVRVTDAGMLFAPSRDGISHDPGEWTDWDDCAAATRVLAAALADLAGE